MCRDNDASNPPVSLTAEIKARLHAAYDSLPGIFLFRADGTEELVFANQDALTLYQCKSFRELREKIGTHFSHFLQPDDYLPRSAICAAWKSRCSREQTPTSGRSTTCRSSMPIRAATPMKPIP